MKLSPFEQAIDKAATRILRKHMKEIEAAATLFYTRAVGQAVEHLNAKTSPAKKANATRKEIARLRDTLRAIRNQCLAHIEQENDAPWGILSNWASIIDDALAPNEGRPA